MSGVADWVERDARRCWHPYTQHGLGEAPLVVTGARGAWLELADGRRVLDAISSWWSVLHGHGQPELVRAMEQQAQRLDHVLFAGCTHPPAIELAEALASAAPSGLTRVFYSDDGSTAVEVALKLSYQLFLRRGEPRRTTFLALDGGYHGDTFGAMAAGDPRPFFSDFAPLLFDVHRAPATVEGLEEAFAQVGDNCAALIVEPLVQGAAGMRMYGAEVLQAARGLCDAHGTLLIADEVMTGFGRTGTLFASEQAGVCPDLMCLAKGLTGGMLPLAATLAREDIYAAFLGQDRGRAFFHGHTFTGNPIACAVALASLALVDRDDVPGRLARLGERLESGLEPLRGLDGVREVRRLGGIVAVELRARDGDAGYLSDAGERLRAACRDREVLLRPLGNVLYAMPPACTTDAEIDLIADHMRHACRAALEAP